MEHSAFEKAWKASLWHLCRSGKPWQAPCMQTGIRGQGVTSCAGCPDDCLIYRQAADTLLLSAWLLAHPNHLERVIQVNCSSRRKTIFERKLIEHRQSEVCVQGGTHPYSMLQSIVKYLQAPQHFSAEACTRIQCHLYPGTSKMDGKNGNLSRRQHPGACCMMMVQPCKAAMKMTGLLVFMHPCLLCLRMQH